MWSLQVVLYHYIASNPRAWSTSIMIIMDDLTTTPETDLLSGPWHLLWPGEIICVLCIVICSLFEMHFLLAGDTTWQGHLMFSPKKNDEKNLIRQNQIALFIHIQLFFLSIYKRKRNIYFEENVSMSLIVQEGWSWPMRDSNTLQSFLNPRKE